MTWHKWQIQLGNSLRVMVTKPTDEYGSLYQVAALGWTWTGLPWLSLIPVKDVPRMWIVNIWLRETHLHSLSLWTWKFFFLHWAKGQDCAYSSTLVTWLSFPATEHMFQTPNMTSTSTYHVLIYLHLLFCLIQCVYPRQYSGHLSVFSSSSDIPFLFHLGKSCVFSCILCLLVIS